MVGSGLVSWHRADIGVSLNSGNVSAWADQSGNGNDYSQANAPQQPVFETNAFNGRPSILFDGIDDLLTCSTAFANNWMGGNDKTYTVFIAGELLAAGNQMLFGVGHTSGAQPAYWYANLTTTGNEVNKRDDASLAINASGGTTTAARHIIEIYSNGAGTQANLRVDGISKISGVAEDVATLTVNQAVIGGRVVAGVYTSGNWRIAEFIVFNKSLSAQDRESFRKYLGQLYQIGVT